MAGRPKFVKTAETGNELITVDAMYLHFYGVKVMDDNNTFDCVWKLWLWIMIV